MKNQQAKKQFLTNADPTPPPNPAEGCRLSASVPICVKSRKIAALPTANSGSAMIESYFSALSVYLIILKYPLFFIHVYLCAAI